MTNKKNNTAMLSVFGVCNLLYYASGIIEGRVDDMHASEQIPTIDKNQRREIQEKKQGIIISEMLIAEAHASAILY